MRIHQIMNLYRSRKYLLRILLSILLLIVLFLVVSSMTQYYNFEKTVLDIQNESNRKVLNQVNYNIEYMNELVKHLSSSLYSDGDVVSLLNSKTISVFDLTQKLDRLRNTVLASSFLHSIMVYNSLNGCYYTSLSTGVLCEGDGLGGKIDLYLDENTSIEKLRFIPMYAADSDKPNENLDFFSVFMFDTPDSTYRRQSTLIVNVNSRWLFDNINNINKLTEQKDSSIAIMDNRGNIFNASETRLGNQGDLMQTIRDHISRSGNKTGYLNYGEGRDKKIVSYITSQTNDWVIINIQTYDLILGQLSKMRTISIVLISVFLLLSIIVTVFISLGLYKPIEHILRQINKTSSHEKAADISKGKDEFSIISNKFNTISHEFNQALEHIGMLRREQAIGKDIMKMYYLRKLIIDSATISHEELHRLNEKNPIRIDLSKPALLCVLKIDDYYTFQNFTPGNQKLLKFAISNIVNEIVSVQFPNEVVDMRNDHFVLLINVDVASREPMYSEITRLLKKAQAWIVNYYHISFTAALSDPVEHFGIMDKHYWITLEYSLYRLIAGKSAVILPSAIKHNIGNKEFEFPVDIEKELIEGLKGNNITLIKEYLAQLFRYLSTLKHINITFLIFHTIVMVMKALREINANNIQQISIDLQPYYKKIIEYETLQEMQDAFVLLFTDICNKRKDASQQGINPILIDTIKDIIEANYADANLGLQSIASMTQLSTSHIGRIFRQHEAISIADYITEFRLNQALIMLEDKKLNINEILEKVGFNNKSYFFKLFKMKYGTTPKKFRIKKGLE